MMLQARFRSRVTGGAAGSSAHWRLFPILSLNTRSTELEAWQIPGTVFVTYKRVLLEIMSILSL